MSHCNRKRFTPYQRNKIAASQKWSCKTCTRMLDENFDIDHIRPLFLGGTNDFENLQALCISCHASKSRDEQSRKFLGIPEKHDTKLSDNEKQHVVELSKKSIPDVICSKCCKRVPFHFFQFHMCSA